MKLYLVQHAKAKSKEEDPDRPLTTEGQQDVMNVAAYLATRMPIRPKRILHSGKTRARQTAELLAETLQPADGVQEASDLQALDDPSLWAERLSELEGDTVLVGHKPYMPKLAALLVCQDEDNDVVAFQKGGVVCLSRDSEGNWLIEWNATPQLIGA